MDIIQWVLQFKTKIKVGSGGEIQGIARQYVLYIHIIVAFVSTV